VHWNRFPRFYLSLNYTKSYSERLFCLQRFPRFYLSLNYTKSYSERLFCLQKKKKKICCDLLAICLEIDPGLKYTLYIQAGTHTHTPLLLHLKAFCCTCKSFDTMQLTDKEEKPSISLRQLTANEALTQIKEKKIRFFKGIHWNHRRKQLKKRDKKEGREYVCVWENSGYA